MAKLFNGKIKLANSISQTGAQPLDDRVVVATHNDLYDSFGTAIYNGMMVVVNDEQALYILIDKANVNSDEGWKKVGNEPTASSVDTPTEAMALATADNIGQVIYVKNDGKIDDADYSAGPYIVTGAGTLTKLGTTTPSGDISADVANLKTDVTNLKNGKSDINHKHVANDITDGVFDVTRIPTGTTETTVAIGNHTHNAYAEKSAVTESVKEINTKIDKISKSTEDLSSSINEISAKTDTNVTNIAAISGTVDNNSAEIGNLKTSVDTIKDFKIKNVNTDDKILSLSDAGFISAKVSLAYGKGEGSSENDLTTKTYIKLLGKDNKVFSQIDASEFIKDGMINEVSYDPASKNLKIAFNTEAGKDPVNIDLSSLVDTYTAGKGLALGGNQFSIKLKEGEKYLQLDADGNLISKGIDDAISNAVSGKLDTTVYQEYTGAIETKLTEINDKIGDGFSKDSTIKSQLDDVKDSIIAYKADDASIKAATADTIVTFSVKAVDVSKVTGLDAAITAETSQIQAALDSEITNRNAADTEIKNIIGGSFTTANTVNAAIAKKVDANAAITSATKCKITYDAKGLVTAGADLAASDIPALGIAKISGLQDKLNTIDSGVSENTAAIKTLNGNLEYKVDKADGSRLMTNAEGTKLANIQEGAEKNTIIEIQVDGTTQTPKNGIVNIETITGNFDFGDFDDLNKVNN